jgi:hypothetical protein
MSVIVQQDATFYSFYSLQTALRVSGDTFTHHQVHKYSLLALLMVGEGVTRNRYSSLQGIKTVQSRILLDNY